MIGIIIITGILLSLYGLAYLLCHNDKKEYKDTSSNGNYKSLSEFFRQSALITGKKNEEKEVKTNVDDKTDEAYILDISVWKDKQN